MKKNLIILILILFASILIASNSDWHLKRNKHNKLPIGQLIHRINNKYKDQSGRIWELQSHFKNKLHQPDNVVKKVDNPYPNVTGKLILDPENPNLKFLSVTRADESYEAILQPNGKYLSKGPKQGTYNYGHPSGLIGNLKHFFLDMMPHFINRRYQN